MIAAQELRIGNWVLLDTGFTLPFPHKIRSKDIYDVDEGNVNAYSLEPIPISPEILEKAGFEKGVDNNGNLVVYRKSKYTIAWWGTRWQFWIGTIDLTTSPQSVHQLQNLIFCLTGTDLQISL